MEVCFFASLQSTKRIHLLLCEFNPQIGYFWTWTQPTHYTSIEPINPYWIQNCFSTISTKILVNHYYFRDLWRILERKYLWITHIFAMYSDLSVVSIFMVISAMPNHQLWWFLVWFICRITNFFTNSSDFYSDYICFFASTLAQFGYHF